MMARTKRTWQSETAATTEAVGRALAEGLLGDEIILLYGDLGVGKTVLVRGLAAGLGFAPSVVQSPTFALVHEHEHENAGAVGKLFHIDLYRLTPGEAEAMGIDECLAGPGVKAVEWPERLPATPQDAIIVAIDRRGDQGRTIHVEGPAAIIDALG
jgi:tRNA threonylcarbamoyladenosine biosynthesis protein TsaE